MTLNFEKIKLKIEIIGIIIGILATVLSGIYFLYLKGKDANELQIINIELFTKNQYPELRIMIQNISSMPQIINSIEYKMSKAEYTYDNVDYLTKPIPVKYDWLIKKNDLNKKNSLKPIKQIITEGEIAEFSFRVGFKEPKHSIRTNGYLVLNFGKSKNIIINKKIALDIDNGSAFYPVPRFPSSDEELLILLKNTNDSYTISLIMEEITRRNVDLHYDFIDKYLNSKIEEIVLSSLKYIKEKPKIVKLKKIVNLSINGITPDIKKEAFSIMTLFPIESLEILQNSVYNNQSLANFYISRLKLERLYLIRK